jgi:hypothetical protein
MIEIDVLLGLGTMKIGTGSGKIQDKEYEFIKLRREGITVRLAFCNQKGIEELQRLLDEIKLNIKKEVAAKPPL